MNELSAPVPAERACRTCACAARMNRQGVFFDLADPVPGSFVICRRNMPQAAETTTRVPRRNEKTGEPERNAQGQQVFESLTAIQIGYPATLPEAVCFDGWRPRGTAPGALWNTDRAWTLMRPLLEQACSLAGFSPQQVAVMLKMLDLPDAPES
jgi:hypothetical protein